MPPVRPMTSSATASICAGLAALCRSAASPYRCWESDTPPTSALCAAHRTPVLGSEPQQECLRAEQGRMERAEPGGTAVYTLRLQAEYTQLYTEEMQ